MIMLSLQWIGSIAVIVGYYLILKRPLLSSCLTCLGCIVTGLWAALIEPMGLGVIALEVFIGSIAIRNIWRLRYRT